MLQNLKALGSKGLISIATLIIIVLVGVGGFIGGRYCYYKAEKLLEERLVETEKGLERISFLFEEKVKLLSIIPEEYNEGLRLNTIYFNIDENPICTNSFIIQEDSIIDLTYQTLTWTSEKIIKDNRVPFLRWLEFGKTKLPSDGYYNLIYEPISKKEKKLVQTMEQCFSLAPYSNVLSKLHKKFGVSLSVTPESYHCKFKNGFRYTYYLHRNGKLDEEIESFKL